LSSASHYHALDETGVFGCACRHEFPRTFVNLKHGERLGAITRRGYNIKSIMIKMDLIKTRVDLIMTYVNLIMIHTDSIMTNMDRFH